MVTKDEEKERFRKELLELVRVAVLIIGVGIITYIYGIISAAAGC